MEVARLKAEPRTAIGRNQVRHLRTQGWLPAIVYGLGQEPVPIRVSEWELDQHIRHHHRVYRLEIEGAAQDAYLQDIQFDTLTDRPRHADFKRIDLDEPIELEVEVTLLGHPVGLGKGGVLIKDHQGLRIRCLPTAIPEELSASIAALEVDGALTAGEVSLPEGVELASDPGMVICHVAKAAGPQPTEAAPAAPAEGEGEEGAPEQPGAGGPAKE